jgi:anaerobic ribonucleoside-triphosphate reductase activating protein
VSHFNSRRACGNCSEQCAPAPRLSVILFSGYTLPEITSLPKGRDILSYVDVLIAGRYDQTRRIATGLRGSTNKTVHLLTDRYSFQDIEVTPDAEVIVGSDGSTTISGIAPPQRPDKL